MGRHKKGVNTAEEVEAFSVDKEKQLEKFSGERKSLISKEEIARFDIKPVPRLHMLSGKGIEGFVGKSYTAAISEAYVWRDRYNNQKDVVKKIKLVDYFVQEAYYGVLVSYNI